jgi:hypothetical protein
LNVAFLEIILHLLACLFTTQKPVSNGSYPHTTPIIFLAFAPGRFCQGLTAGYTPDQAIDGSGRLPSEKSCIFSQLLMSRTVFIADSPGG